LSYESAIQELLKLGHELHQAPPGKFELSYVRVLLEALGHPERRFKSVLIAGTNGKGSTAATLSSILIAAGHRTGLYTSPHLVRVNERIRINDVEISDDDFSRVYDRVEAVAQQLLASGHVPWHPSFFEMLTAMCFLYFAEGGVEVAVLEAGMGGRLDATNVVEAPCISVITDISLDHMKYLGNTIREIAREKAGIIRPGGVVVTLPQHPEANDVIGNTILELNAKAANAVQYVPPVSPGAPPASTVAEGGELRNRYPLAVMGREIMVDSPLYGRHQFRNIALAVAAAEQLNDIGVRVSPDDIERGIRQTRWPGRFQVVPAAHGYPDIVLDGAHNPAGAWALRAALSQRYPDAPITMVFGVMRDKAVSEVVEILFPLATRVIVVQPHNPRAASAEEIRAAASRICTNILSESTVAAAIERACSLVQQDESLSEAAERPTGSLVVVAGSIYVVGEALTALEERRSNELV
jgi:dihydrofolate synthase/folylpolyglutamate synthase